MGFYRGYIGISHTFVEHWMHSLDLGAAGLRTQSYDVVLRPERNYLLSTSGFRVQGLGFRDLGFRV